jgi:hypothetical protein
MPNSGHGLERGVGIIAETAVVAIIIGEVVPLLMEQGLLPRGLFWWVIPVSIVSVVLTIDASRYWSWGYLGGVVIGIFIALPIFLEAGLLSALDLVIYSGLAIGAIVLRLKIHSSGL